MKISITGGSGFVGTHLARHLLEQGHQVTALGTRPTHHSISHEHFAYLSADTKQPGPWQQSMAEADVIFNLAGRTIFKRWSAAYKQEMYDSRILTTRNLVEALPDNTRATLVSTSAVGYYGSGGDDELNEENPPGRDFLSELSLQWEAEALNARVKGARVALARFGIVLGSDGGALAQMMPAFKAFVGGPLGDGKQWFPWIHIFDHIEALCFLATRSELSGAFNLCAPDPVRNSELAAALGRALGRPAIMTVPGFMLKIAMGEMADVLLSGQRTVPANLLAAGFKFRFNTLSEALADLV